MSSSLRSNVRMLFNPTSRLDRGARRRRDHFAPSFDTLESRVALSINTLVAGTPSSQSTFVDAYGNAVNVAVSGTTGTAAFYDEFGNLGVDDGENIGSVSISGASKDFTLTYSVVSDSDDDNTIKMGNIVAGAVRRRHQRV